MHVGFRGLGLIGLGFLGVGEQREPQSRGPTLMMRPGLKFAPTWRATRRPLGFFGFRGVLHPKPKRV